MAAIEMRDVHPASASSSASSASGSGCHSGCSLRAEDDLRRQRVAACLAMLSAPASPSAPRPSIRSAARIYNLPKSTVHRLLQQTRGGSPTKRRRARPAFAASLVVAKARLSQSNQQRPPKKSAIDFILSPEPAGARSLAARGARSVQVAQNVIQPSKSSVDNLVPNFPRPVMEHVNRWDERAVVKDSTAPFLEPFPEPVPTPRFTPQGCYSFVASQRGDYSWHQDDEIVSTSACKSDAAASVMYQPRLAGNQLPSQYSSANMSKVTGVEESGKASLAAFEPLHAGVQGFANKNRISSSVHAEETSPAPRAPSHILDPAWTLISLMERTRPRCQS